MIVSVHVATGAVAGAATGSRSAAVVLGLVLHALCDRVPHQDVDSRRFEIGTGVAGLLLIVLTRGPFDPATVGAAASSAPDLEHVLRLPRPGGRKLFPSHRVPGWHRPGGVPASVQFLAAGSILGALAATGRARRSGR